MKIGDYIKIINRILLTILGSFLILLVFPHRTPWDMTNLARDVAHHVLVFNFKIPFFPVSLTLTTTQVLLSLAVYLFIALLSVPAEQLKQGWRSWRAHRTAFFAGIIAFEAFMLTLIPSEPYFVTTGPAVVMYLLVSSFGLFFFMAGTLPLIRRAVAHQSVSVFLEQSYDFLRKLVFESNPRLFIGSLILAEFLLANWISYAVFGHIPHIQDSITQVFHAKIFAQGHLTAPSPPLGEFFEFIHMINDGRWYSQYPPGHTALLALGVLLGAPWVINPLLGALTVGVLYLLGKELYGERTGRIAASLTFLSPFVLFMSSEFMNHTSSLFFFALFLLFFARTLRRGSLLDSLIAGAAIGWLGCIRPYTAAGLAAPLLLFGLIQVTRRFKELWRPFLGFTLTALSFAAVLLLFNQLTNGDPLMFGYEKLWGADIRPGFRTSPWGPSHTITNGFQSTISNLNGINKYLFEWPVPSLAFVVLFFCSGKARSWDFLHVASFFSLAGFYFFYWFQDWCFGPRFLYEATPGLFLLTARGIDQVPSLWNETLGFTSSLRTLRMVTAGVLLLFVTLGLATNIPPHLTHYGRSYWGVNPDVINAVKEKKITGALIFVRSHFGSVFTANDPFLKSGNVFVKDNGDDNILILKYFPGRKTYWARGSRVEPYDLK